MSNSEFNVVYDKYNKCEGCKELIPQNIKICLGCRIKKTLKGNGGVYEDAEHKVPKV